MDIHRLYIAAVSRFDLVSLFYWCAFLSIGLMQFGEGMGAMYRLNLARVATLLSLLLVLCKFIYQMVLLGSPYGPYEKLAQESTWTSLLGFNPIYDALGAVQQFVPEIVVAALGALRWELNDKIAMRRIDPRTVRAVRKVAVLMSVLLLASLVLAALALPNALSVFYLVYLFVELSLWALRNPIHAFAYWIIRSCMVLYLTLHSLALFIYQFPTVTAAIPEGAAQVLGLFVYFSGSYNYASYVYALGILAAMVVVVLRQILYRHYMPSKAIMPSFATNYGLASLLKAPDNVMIVKMTTEFARRNAASIASWCLIALSITYPSYLTLPMLVWSCMALIYGAVFRRTRLLAMVYVECVVLVQTIFNINGTFFPAYPDVGLVRFPVVYISLGFQCLLLIVFVCVFPTTLLPSDMSSMNPMSISEDPDHKALPKDVNTVSKWTWSDFKNFIVIAMIYFSRFVLQYAYLISLLVLYLCGLQEVNVLNSGFIIYFITFLIFPAVARFAWTSLVLYTELVILLQFIWQFSFARQASLDSSELWGLRKSDNGLWSLLVYHVIILFFTGVQLQAYRLLDRRSAQQTRSYDPENHSSDSAEEHILVQFEQLAVVQRIGRVKQFLSSVVTSFTFVVCYLCYLLIGFLGVPTLMDYGYLAILFTFLLFHQFRADRYVKRIWLVACLYPAIVAASAYLYQFKDLQNFLIGVSSVETLAAIGLVSQSGPRLFEYLLQHVVALLLCVFQYRILAKRMKIIPLDDAASKVFSPIIPDFIETIKKISVVHSPKLVLLFVFMTTVDDVSLAGFITLVYLTIVIPSRGTYLKSRPVLLIWLEILISAKLLYQIYLRATNISNNDIAWGGLSPAVPLKDYIVLLVLLALEIVNDRWKEKIMQSGQNLPAFVADWPLLRVQSETLTAPSAVSPPGTLRRFAEEARVSVYEFHSAVNFWLSNTFNQYGEEILLFVHLIAAYALNNAVGLFYVCWVGLLLKYRIRNFSKVWPTYLAAISIGMIFKFASALGYPPSLSIQYPWASWDRYLLHALGIPVTPADLYLMPDFFVLLFSSFYMTVFAKARVGTETFRPWAKFNLRFKQDFTVKPRSKVNQLSYVFTRYFIWVPVLLAFALGTSYVNLLCSVFLVMSLYYISVGEVLLTRRVSRQRLWKMFIWYSYSWFLFQIGYQIPAYILDLDNQSFETGWGQTWRILLGFTKMSLDPSKDDGTTPIFNFENVLACVMFFAILIQRKLNSGSALKFVVRYIRKDAKKAHDRAEDYMARRRQANLEKKRRHDDEIALLRKSVARRKGQADVIDDWIDVFGRRDTESGYAIVNPITRDDGEIVFGVTEVDDCDPLADEQSEARKSPSHNLLQPQLSAEPSATSLTMDRDAGIDVMVVNPIQDSLQPGQTAKVPSFFERQVDKVIDMMYKFAIDYTDLYVTTSEAELYGKRHADESRAWGLIRSTFYAITAHTALLAFLSIYANQVYHGNVLSTIPTFAVLLFGIIQRPYPGYKFWNFIIFTIESTILLKYFFQFEVWKFNRMACPPRDLSRPIYVIGVQKSCGNFFSEVSTELVVLIACVMHRGLMKRLGLWKMDLTAIDDPETDNMSGTELSNISTPVSPPQQTLTTAEIIRELERQQMEELQPDPIDLTPGFFQKTQMRLKRWHRKFFDTSSLPGEDYYVGYFTADLFVFILTIIFWPSFSGDLSVAGNNLEFLSAVIYQNAVPQLFVAILVTNFVLILVDRAIYVSKSVKAKLVMQFVTVIAFSIWIFFVLPPSNGAPFSSLQGLQVWFLTKTIYWYFSAKQIKMGFPDVRLANFFLRNHSQLNNYAFMIFRSIPFVWEFRSLTDWTLADTCLDLYNWLKFEDIFANLYVVQNTRAFQKQDPRMFGEPQKRGFKYICGGLSVTGLVILIWFPLILLSIPGAKKPHPIGTLKFSMQLSGFQPLYTQMLPAGGIQNLTDSQFADLRSQGDISSLFPSYLVTGTMQHALLPPSSLTSWLINPPAQQELLRTLRNPNESFYLITNYEFDKAEVSLPQTTRGQFFASLTNETRYELANAIESNEDYAVMIPNAYPRFLRALASGSVQNLAPDWRPYLDIKVSQVKHNRGQYYSQWSGMVGSVRNADF